MKFINQNPSFVVCLAETWYTESHNIARSSPYFLSDSTLLTRREKGHQLGGVLVLRHPQLGGISSSIHRSEAYTTFKVSTSTISCVYFQPSMPIDQVQKNMDEIKDVEIIVGDINTQFGSLFNCKSSQPPDRIALFQNFCLTHSFNLCVPELGNTKLDHVLSKSNCISNYQSTPPLVDSDHPLSLLFNLEAQSTPSNVDEPTRFHLKLLETPLNVKSLQDAYEIISSDLLNFYPNINVDVDVLDQLLVEFITMSCEMTLGTYSPHVARSLPDTELCKLQQSTSHSDSIRLFRRGCRPFTRSIQSRTATATPIDDVTQFFTEIYTQDNQPLHNRQCKWPVTGSSWRTNEEELKKIITKYASHKSCGEDGIHVKILRCLIDGPFMSHLTTLMNLCLSTGQTPERWNTARVMPTPKTSDAKTINDFRPISLTVMFRRIFEKIILRRFEPLIKLNAGQAGFRKGFSTTTQVAVAHDRGRNAFIHRVFIDLKQAYDRVPLVKVLQEVHLRDPPPGLVSILQSLFLNCKVRIVVNRCLTSSILLTRGLLQGSLLSPLLFSIFIDKLANSINESYPVSEMPGLFFADDIQLVHRSSIIISETLNTVKAWCDETGMLINMRKTLTTSASADFRIGNSLVGKCSEYKYLGIVFGSHGVKFAATRDSRLANGAKILKFCQRFQSAWSLPAKLAIFKSFIRPAFEYGGVLGYKFYLHSEHLNAFIQPYESFANQCISWISNMNPRFNNTCRMVMALPSMSRRFEYLSTRLAESLTYAHSDNPIHIFKSLASTTFWIKYLSKILWIDDLFSKYKREQQALPEDDRISLSRYLKKLALEHLKSEIPQLSKYISRHSRTSSNLGCDYSILLPNETLRTFCLRWRVNSFCLSKLCTCGENLTRGHIARCIEPANPHAFMISDLTHLPPGILTTDMAINTGNWNLLLDQIQILNSLQSRQTNNTT